MSAVRFSHGFIQKIHRPFFSGFIGERVHTPFILHLPHKGLENRFPEPLVTVDAGVPCPVNLVIPSFKRFRIEFGARPANLPVKFFLKVLDIDFLFL